MNDVELIQVIRTRLTHLGAGIEGDPHRIVTQYWSPEGELLAEAKDEFGQEEINALLERMLICCNLVTNRFEDAHPEEPAVRAAREVREQIYALSARRGKRC